MALIRSAKLSDGWAMHGRAGQSKGRARRCTAMPGPAMAKLSGANRCKAQQRNGLAQRFIARSGIAKALLRIDERSCAEHSKGLAWRCDA